MVHTTLVVCGLYHDLIAGVLVLSVTLERIYSTQCIQVINLINPNGMLNG